MPISFDLSGATLRIKIPQSYLTLISGSLYELDTGQLWEDIKAWEAGEDGIIFQDAQTHNPTYTVAGVTYARKIEILNASNSSNIDVYEIFFDPDTQYSVRLAGSNNNIFDLENSILANTTTQVIPQNSAGLIITSGGGGGTTATEVWQQVIEGTLTAEEMMRIMLSGLAGKLSGAATTNVKIRDVADSKDRIDATVDSDGNRTDVTLDGS